MILSQIIEERYKNVIENIKKMENRLEKAKAIKALICDLAGKGITIVANLIGMAFATIKRYYETDFDNLPSKEETRGRKKVEVKFTKLISQIKEIVSNYENVDSHFKSETVYVDLTLENLRKELINQYNYDVNDCPCENTLSRILKELGYKIQKVSKSKVQSKIPETDVIFDNVNETKKFLKASSNEVAVVSIDDKARKKIGDISDNGYSWFERKALDHDTKFDCTINPFGILDLKTNEPFIYCTKGNSTADFKVDCIEDYLKRKLQEYLIKRLIIFLDNGPENNSHRTLWIKRLVELSIKYKVAIELVYYPPYHSKYNMIERYWARLQLSWNGLIINTVDKLINVINKTTWKDVYSTAFYIDKKYQKGITIDKLEMKKLEEKHIYREEGIEKWSLVITP